MAKKISKILFLFLICLTVLIGCDKKEKDSLSLNDNAAYTLIVEVSYEFKNPSSVRVLSGSLYYDEDKSQWSGWFALSATNSYGARTTGYYFVSHLDGEIFALDLEEHGTGSDIKKCKETEDFNADQVNEKLKERWENYL